MSKSKKDFTFISGRKYDAMMGRCYRKTDISYKNYGERGIKVCSEWIIDINNFRKWLALELIKNSIDTEDFVIQSRKYQLDRIDSEGHYTPNNCRLSSPQLNSRNKKFAKRIIESSEGTLHELGK
jgi:hypothetical protein